MLVMEVLRCLRISRHRIEGVCIRQGPRLSDLLLSLFEGILREAQDVLVLKMLGWRRAAYTLLTAEAGGCRC